MIIPLLISLLGLGGMLMASLGSYTLVKCQQSSLASWMIAAGLFIMVTAFFTIACRLRGISLAVNFATGCLLLLSLWLWLALWVAGSYLVAQAIDSGRVREKNNQCDDAALAVATFFLILVWILFAGLCLKKVTTLLLTRKPDEDDDPGQQQDALSEHLFP